MKIFIAFLLMISSLSAYAALKMKPGLWEIEMSMGGPDGKQADPMAEMRKAMAGMSPEQQKQMAAMMGKMGGVGIAPGGAMRICFTEEMLKNEENLNQQKGKKCTSTIKEKSSSKIIADFKCEDGSAGTSIFNIKDSSNYTGNVDATDKNGQQSQIAFKGKFASSDCGDVKPLNAGKQASAQPVAPPTAKPKTTTP